MLDFMVVENGKGFVQAPTSLETSRGQEMLKLLMYRVIEEYAESLESVDPKHVKEELIDAFNFLCELLLLEDPNDLTILHRTMLEAVDKVLLDPEHSATAPNEFYCRKLVEQVGKLGNFLRNRPWMNNAQDVYFSGREELQKVVYWTAELIMESFDDWDDFWRFYTAKDRVLAFRLRSNY